MPLKNILVHVDGSPASERRLRAGLALARRHDAHLTALFVIDTLFPYYAVDSNWGYLDAGGMQPLIDEMTDRAKATERQSRTSFDHLLVSEAVRGEWRCVEGSTAETLLLHAFYADLCVMGPEDPSSPARPPGGYALERVLFASGRPVLVIPTQGEFERIGTHVLIGWKPCREAARATNDALPILEAATRSTILTLVAEQGTPPATAAGNPEIATHLARHGVEITSEVAPCEPGHEGRALLNAAVNLGADLLVAGGYGHSRLREFILGGATRTILREAPMPVLLSH